MFYQIVIILKDHPYQHILLIRLSFLGIQQCTGLPVILPLQQRHGWAGLPSFLSCDYQ